MRSRSLWTRLRTCARGSMLVGYSSLALLVALAAITLLAAHDMGFGGGRTQRAPGTASTD